MRVIFQAWICKRVESSASSSEGWSRTICSVILQEKTLPHGFPMSSLTPIPRSLSIDPFHLPRKVHETPSEETVTLMGLDIEIRIAFKGQAKALKQFRNMLVPARSSTEGAAIAAGAGAPDNGTGSEDDQPPLIALSASGEAVASDDPSATGSGPLGVSVLEAAGESSSRGISIEEEGGDVVAPLLNMDSGRALVATSEALEGVIPQSSCGVSTPIDSAMENGLSPAGAAFAPSPIGDAEDGPCTPAGAPSVSKMRN